jgi:GTP-binding protein
VYKNQIIGVSSTDRTEDLNVCEAKKLTNVRAAGSDDKVEAPKTIIPTIEYAMGFICDSPVGAKDAYKEKVEVTPKSIRMFRTYNRGG